MRAIALVLAATATAFPAAAVAQSRVAAPSTQWTLAYEGQSTNDVSHDAHFASLIRSHLSAKFSARLVDALGGPPEPVFVVERRYVSMSACVPHMCLLKGFFWVDTKLGVAMGAIFDADNDDRGTLQIGSSDFPAAQMPAPAKAALIHWLSENEITPTRIEILDRVGAVSTMDPAALQPVPRFKPRPGGPSFDCAGVTRQIPVTICGDSALSAQDLALGDLVERMRRGYSTTGARDELLEMQRLWEVKRSVECGVAPDVKACIAKSSRNQTEKLMHWIPKR